MRRYFEGYILKDIDFAIEKGFRLFENGIQPFHFFMIQVRVKKMSMPDGQYTFILKTHNKFIYSRTILIDSTHQRIVTPNSHEDPLVQANDDYLLCFQLWDKDIEQILDKNETEYLIDLMDDKTLKKPLNNIAVGNLNIIFSSLFVQHSHLINDYILQTDKACKFRLHLGQENGQYHEEEYDLKAGETFNFQSYLHYPYVGLQCSYEKEVPEVEEKHIVIGQKGMILSGEYHDKNSIYKALMPFNHKYQILYVHTERKETNTKEKEFAQIKYEVWTEVQTLTELLNFYKNKNISFFEMDKNFLIPCYKKEKTYGLLKVVTNKIAKKHHIDLPVCSQCPYTAKCMQIVPSGLSQDLFKHNLLLEISKDCEIYQLIQKKDIKV